MGQGIRTTVLEEGGVATLREFLDKEKMPSWFATETKELLERYDGSERRPGTDFMDRISSSISEYMPSASTFASTRMLQGGDDIPASVPRRESEADMQTKTNMKQKLDNRKMRLDLPPFLRHIKEAVECPRFPWLLLGTVLIIMTLIKSLGLRNRSFYMYSNRDTKTLGTG
jgi:hypothetical protein